MIELQIKTMDADDEGWSEVVIVTLDDAVLSAAPEGDTLGWVREVEGTADGPTTWWDSKVVEETQVHYRRFMSLEAALLALASRPHLPVDARRLVGW